MMRSVTAAALAATVACSQPERPAKQAEPAPAVSVETVTVAATETDDVYRASGTVRARYTAVVAAKMVGQIQSIYAEPGDRVKPGQTLVVLDSRDLQANLRRAEAVRSEAQNAITEVENAIAGAKANLELARVTHKRFEDLLAKGSVSQQEFDESQARFRSAEAALQMAVAKRNQIEAKLAQAEAEVSAARIALGYATLAAPFAGLVTERRADPGSLATPGVPLLLIEQEGSLRLEASLDESRLGLARIGQTVEVEIGALDRRIAGRVAEIVPAVDAATRSFTAKIDLPALSGLRAGMFGRALFPAGKRRLLLVPNAAVSERGQIQSVFAVEGGVARLRLVSLGTAAGDRREVLTGLKEGDQVVLSPPAALTDGSRVK